MKDYVLNKVNDAPNMYILQRPGEYMESTEIIFAFNRTWIGGDRCPFLNGCVSNLGYGENWFSKEKDQQYLCSKFGFPRVWEAERCVLSLEDELREMESDILDSPEYTDELQPQIDTFRDAIAGLRSGSMGEAELYQFMQDAGHEFYDGIPGYGYPTRDANLLTEIQHTFARLKAPV